MGGTQKITLPVQAQPPVYNMMPTAFVTLPSVPLSVIRYAIPFGDTLSTTSLATIFTVKGKLLRLAFGIANPQSGTGSLVITVQKNGVDTTLQATCPAGGGVAIYTDNNHEVPIDVNDYMDFEIQNNATVASALISSIVVMFQFL